MIDSALRVLEDAISMEKTARTPEVSAALRTIAAACSDHSGLEWYWTSTITREPIDRFANLRASLNRIRLILDGWRQDGSPCGLLKPPRGRRR